MCRKVRQKGKLKKMFLQLFHSSISFFIKVHVINKLCILYILVEGNWRYLRSCAWLGEPGVGSAGGYTPDERYCIHRSGTYNIHVEYCTCR